MHIPFDTRSVAYDDHIFQIGGGNIIDKDENELLNEPYTYYRGINPYQRGYGYRQSGAGIGDVLRGIWRYILPAVRKVGTSVGKEALSTGERILDKIAEGGNVKEAIIEEGKKGIDTILEKGRKQIGSGAIKRRRKLEIPIHQTLVGRKVYKPLQKTSKPVKRKRVDTFGLY